MIKNLAILSLKLIFLIFAFLQKLWQSICSCICFALALIDSKMVTKKLLGPTNLSGAQVLCIYKATKVVVVCKDKYFVFVAFQIVTLCLKGFDNSEKFAVMGLVSSLYRNHFSQKKSYQILLAQIGLSNYPIRISFGSQLT